MHRRVVSLSYTRSTNTICLKLSAYLSASVLYCNKKMSSESFCSQYCRWQFLLELCNWHFLWQLCRWQHLFHLRRFWGGNFCYRYVGGSFCCNYVYDCFCCNYAVRRFCSTYAGDSFCSKYVGYRFYSNCEESLLQLCKWFCLQWIIHTTVSTVIMQVTLSL